MNNIKSKNFPFRLFCKWFYYAKEQYKKHNIDNFNAASLSTVSDNNKPRSRMVLIKNLNKDGLVFFTNFGSDKAKEIETNNKVSLLFYWEIIKRQVRIEGIASKITNKESDEYFSTRAYLSQIGAWASKQSNKLENLEKLEEQIIFFKDKFKNIVNRPNFWGGYLIKPHYIEFWKERDSRIHRRVAFTILENSSSKVFLYP